MARKVSLESLLYKLRAEAELSLNPAHNATGKASQVALLQQTQERLWEDYAWAHMEVERQIATEAGQRYYETPSDIRIDRVISIEVFSDGAWRPLDPGIGAAEYSAWNSDLDERSWPPRKWRSREDDDIEIWPVPDVDADADTLEGYLKIIGVKNLGPLVADADLCDIDDQLIYLFAAAEILAGKGSKKAPLTLAKATARLERLRGNAIPSQRTKMFVPEPPFRARRPIITQYRPPE